MDYRRRKKQSALIFVLKAFIPYSRENLMLAYKPNKFFYELEKTSKYKQMTLKNAYWRAKKQGFIQESEELVRLTAKGQKEIQPFIAQKLSNNSKLMVIFDIPEQNAAKRRKFRDILKLWDFVQIQKSVWVTDSDYRELLIEAVAELSLSGCVEIYESNRLFPAPAK
jgi:DNA-binding transcriptional regulator PaaX